MGGSDLQWRLEKTENRRREFKCATCQLEQKYNELYPLRKGEGRSQAHERGSMCSFFPWPDSIQISILSPRCV